MFSTMKPGALYLKSMFLALWIVTGAPAGEPLSYSGSLRIDIPQLLLLNKNAVKPVGDRIRICSYNVQDFYDGVNDGTNVTPEMVKRHVRGVAGLLDQINADIVVLEEVENGLALKRLNDALKKPCPVACITTFTSARGEEVKLNIAVLSRVPISGLRELDFGSFSGRGRPPRGMLCFYVELGEGRRLLVYGVHLKSNYGEAAKNEFQRYNAMKILRADADAILSRVPRYEWEILVLGDTNVDPEDRQFARDPTFAPMRGWVDLWRGRPLVERVTLPHRSGDPTQDFPPVTFDRFFATPNLAATPWRTLPPQVLQRGVDTNNIFALPGQGDIHVSDHYPIWVDIIR